MRSYLPLLGSETFLFIFVYVFSICSMCFYTYVCMRIHMYIYKKQNKMLYLADNLLYLADKFARKSVLTHASWYPCCSMNLRLQKRPFRPSIASDCAQLRQSRAIRLCRDEQHHKQKSRSDHPTDPDRWIERPTDRPTDQPRLRLNIDRWIDTDRWIHRPTDRPTQAD